MNEHVIIKYCKLAVINRCIVSVVFQFKSLIGYKYLEPCSHHKFHVGARYRLGLIFRNARVEVQI